MKRRSFLSLVVLGSTMPVVSGCISNDTGEPRTTNSSENDGEPIANASENATDEPTDPPTRPDECPVTQELDVPLPEDISRATVHGFVYRYEQEFIIDRIDDRAFSIEEPSTKVLKITDVGPGVSVQVETVWGVRSHVGTEIRAEPTEDVPEDVDPIDVDDLPEAAEPVGPVARDAVTDDAAVDWTDRTRDHEPIVEALELARAEDDYYVTVEGTPVLVTVSPDSEVFEDGHDVAWYYVDGVVVRRSQGADGDGRDGEVLECFPPDDQWGPYDRWSPDFTGFDTDGLRGVEGDERRIGLSQQAGTVQSPIVRAQSTVRAVVAIAEGKNRTDVLVEALRAYLETASDEEQIQQAIANAYYEDRLEFEQVKDVVGVESARNFRVLKRQLLDDSFSEDLAAALDEWRSSPTRRRSSALRARKNTRARALPCLLSGYAVVIPEQVVDELESMAHYPNRSRGIL